MKKLVLLIALSMLISVRVSASDVPVEYEPCTEPSYTSEEVMLLAEVMYHENNCNGNYIMLLTGSVVLNRVASKEFPDTIHGVLYQRGQYATPKYFGTVHLKRKYYHMAEMLLENGSLAPDRVLYQSMNPRLGSRIWYTKNGEYFAFY